MTSENFCSNLTIKFKAKNDDNRNSVFFDDLITFTNMCPENHLQDVYNWVTINHAYSTPFQLAKIYGYAREKGYIEESSASRKSSPAWWECSDCNVQYGYTGRGCPKCGGYKRKLITGESIPVDVIGMTEDCLYCNMFHDGIVKYKIKLYGGTCGELGIKQDPKCKTCKCQKCCRQMMIYNANPREYFKQKESGELEELFLMESSPIEEKLNNLVNSKRV